MQHMISQPKVGIHARNRAKFMLEHLDQMEFSIHLPCLEHILELNFVYVDRCNFHECILYHGD